MAFGRKNAEEVVMEETKVWICTSDECNCWIRDNFKSSDEPNCPLCKSEMTPSTKMLQVIDNPTRKYS
ncbi:cold-shock protein [Calidifontibacillus erzurumensis]|uniref:Cold-shock protein n=1 Tax=Calidifontibacillus erzurumensis TaxID=2741433 RepID=A0A8J8K811_9BACI|nr:cold-shock protein [Calidifontibacillus erzurumensis]NSL51351.1 cold-shock protein [Calidifontibacillus erzurumensis]